jgi:hypothetical protein
MAWVDTSTIVGLRDRALIGVMTYAFARIGAVVAMRVTAYLEARGTRHLRHLETSPRVVFRLRRAGESLAKERTRKPARAARYCVPAPSNQEKQLFSKFGLR